MVNTVRVTEGPPFDEQRYLNRRQYCIRCGHLKTEHRQRGKCETKDMDCPCTALVV